MGVIALNPQGNIYLEFKDERIHGGWMTTADNVHFDLYKDENLDAPHLATLQLYCTIGWVEL